jgi:hypothetical protein
MLCSTNKNVAAGSLFHLHLPSTLPHPLLPPQEHSINVSTITCSMVCTTHNTWLSQEHILQMIRPSAFSWPQSSLRYVKVWLKLNPHFWKHVTAVICVAQHHNSVINRNASKTLSSVLHDKATCNLRQKKLFLWVACNIKVWMIDYSQSKEMKDVGACVG